MLLKGRHSYTRYCVDLPFISLELNNIMHVKTPGVNLRSHFDGDGSAIIARAKKQYSKWVRLFGRRDRMEGTEEPGSSSLSISGDDALREQGVGT